MERKVLEKFYILIVEVVVDGTTAYVGHTVGPEATTIIEVSDSARPRQIAEIKCNHQGVHAHKVRVQNDQCSLIMNLNHT